MNENQKSKCKCLWLKFLKKELQRLWNTLFIYSRIEEIKGEDFSDYTDEIGKKLKRMAIKLGIPIKKYVGISSDWAKLEEDIKLYADRIQANFWSFFALCVALISFAISMIAIIRGS